MQRHPRDRLVHRRHGRGVHSTCRRQAHAEHDDVQVVRDLLDGRQGALRARARGKCNPGAERCTGSDAMELCANDGTWSAEQVCNACSTASGQGVTCPGALADSASTTVTAQVDQPTTLRGREPRADGLVDAPVERARPRGAHDVVHRRPEPTGLPARVRRDAHRRERQLHAQGANEPGRRPTSSSRLRCTRRPTDPSSRSSEARFPGWHLRRRRSRAQHEGLGGVEQDVADVEDHQQRPPYGVGGRRLGRVPNVRHPSLGARTHRDRRRPVEKIAPRPDASEHGLRLRDVLHRRADHVQRIELRRADPLRRPRG